MRVLPAALFGSVAIHIAAVAWVVRAPDENVALALAPPPPPSPPAPPAEAPPREPPAPPEPPPIEIVFLDDRPSPSPPPPARSEPLPSGAPSDAAPLTHPAISSIDPRTAPEPPAAATSPTPAPADRSRLMALREPAAPPTARAPRVDLSVSQLFEDELFVHDFESRTKPLAPIPDLPGARLDAEIAALRANLRKSGGTGDLARLVELNAAREAVELQPSGGGRYKATSPNFKAKIDRDGKVHIKDNPSFKVVPGILTLTVIFDTTDLAMRAKGMDPYASEKLAFLDRTRDQRVAIGTEHRREQLAQSAHHMRRNIAALWSLTPDLSARKRALFELWDECAESGSDDLLRGAAEARKAVIDHIKAELTGALAYTAAELAQLNARRRSQAAFAPYD